MTDAKPGQDVVVKVEGGKISEFTTTLRFDTETELNYYKVFIQFEISDSLERRSFELRY